MAKRFTRNIRSIEDIEKQPKYTNEQNDLLSDKKDVYVRNQNKYEKITGGVHQVNNKTPDDSGNVEIDTGVMQVNGKDPDEQGNIDVDSGVKTVANVEPDKNGNVNLKMKNIEDINLYVKHSELDEALDEALDEIETGTLDLSGYATEDYVDQAIDGVKIPEAPDLDDYATKNYVDEKVSGIDTGGEAPDLTDYAKKEDVNNLDVGVKTINGRQPQEDGNIVPRIDDLIDGKEFKQDVEDLKQQFSDLEIPESPDLSGYATKQYVDESVEGISFPNLDSYPTYDEVDNSIQQAVDTIDIPDYPDLSDYATEKSVNQKINNIEFPEQPDLSEYPTEQEVQELIKSLTKSGDIILNTDEFETYDGSDEDAGYEPKYYIFGNLCHIFGSVANKNTLKSKTDYVIGKLPSNIKVISKDVKLCPGLNHNYFNCQVFPSNAGSDVKNKIVINKTRRKDGEPYSFPPGSWLNFSMTVAVEMEF